MKDIEPMYSDEGDAIHYDGRINTMNLFENTYGTLAVMYFCEINALKYRLRMGKKPGQSLKQELLKAEWYEKAALYYYKKIQKGNRVIGLDLEVKLEGLKKHSLPWKSNKQEQKKLF